MPSSSPCPPLSPLTGPGLSILQPSPAFSIYCATSALVLLAKMQHLALVRVWPTSPVHQDPVVILAKPLQRPLHHPFWCNPQSQTTLTLPSKYLVSLKSYIKAANLLTMLTTLLSTRTIWITNTSGPSTDPYGTPLVTGFHPPQPLSRSLPQAEFETGFHNLPD